MMKMMKSIKIITLLCHLTLLPLVGQAASLISGSVQWNEIVAGEYEMNFAGTPALVDTRNFFDGLVGDVALSSGTFPDVINDWNPSALITNSRLLIGPAANTLEIDDATAETDLNSALGSTQVTFKMIRDSDSATVFETTATPVFDVNDTGSGVSFNFEISDSYDLTTAGFTGSTTTDSFRYELSYVPEPASLSLILGIAAFAAARCRRRC